MTAADRHRRWRAPELAFRVTQRTLRSRRDARRQEERGHCGLPALSSKRLTASRGASASADTRVRRQSRAAPAPRSWSRKSPDARAGSLAFGSGGVGAPGVRRRGPDLGGAASEKSRSLKHTPGVATENAFYTRSSAWCWRGEAVCGLSGNGRLSTLSYRAAIRCCEASRTRVENLRRVSLPVRYFRHHALRLRTRFDGRPEP